MRTLATLHGLSAADHARLLRAQLSPVAYHLAQLGAAIPLNLTILQLLQRRLLPEARPWHLAELLVSGLLLPTPIYPDAPQVPASARVDLEFVTAGLRRELLADGTRRNTALAMEVVFDHLANAVPGAAGGALRQVRDLVTDPSSAARLPLDEVQAWLTPMLPGLTALDGQHTVAAAVLHRRLRDGQHFDPPHTADAPVDVGDAGSDVSTMRHGCDTQSNVFGSPQSDLLQGETPMPHPGEGGAGSREDDGGNVSVSGVQSDAATTRGDGARKPPPVWGNVPPRNRAFTGREQLLEDLHRRLQEGTTAVLPEALQGMGGVGKSQLAVEYVYRHLGEYQVIWWIPSEQSQQIRQVLVELARRLGLDVGTGEANTAVPAVIEALRVGEPYKNWLLVFDNAEVPEAVREFFPTNGPGRILVTSRNAQWATAARPLEVDVFAREESRQLLQLRAPNLDDDTADRLAETLGDLPLGIEQAAVWLSETGMPADQYLRLFEQQAADLMVSDPPPDYPLSVAAAWNVSLERLQKNHPAALQLLQVCAFFAPEPISRRLLSSVRDAPVPPELAAALSDPIRLSRAIREINRYALARINHATNTIQLHRLVQRVLINQMPDTLKEQMRNGAHRLLAKGDPGTPTDSRQWQQYGELLPHVMNSRAVESTDPWVRQLVLNEIQYMFTWGDHEGSCDLAKLAYKTWRTVDGERSELVLTAAKLYSDALRILGHYSMAYELDQRTRELMTETLGPEHELTLEITGMLAWDLRMRGDFATASELDRETFETTRRLFGSNDLSTLIMAHRVALNLRLTGDFREALELDQDTYRRKVEELGENALSTLATLAGVAVDQMEAGGYIEARDQQQEVVGRYEYNYGPTNPTTIAGYRGLAVTERRAGRHEQALELSARALALFRNRYGDNYPDTLAALLAHAVDVRHNGDLPLALELSTQGCQGYERLFGSEHPHTLGAQVNHAVCLRLLGRSEEARQLNERLLSKLGEKLGEDHPNVLACATNLAADLYELGEVQASAELSTRTLEQSRRRIGEDHPATLATATNLTLGLRLLARSEEADALHTDTMAGYQRTLGADHPATDAAAANKLANCDIDPMPL
jgi:tetratricopeptide (TPR) repeat protein